MAKAKQKAYNELYDKLDTREGLVQIKEIKDRDEIVLKSEESVQRREGGRSILRS